MGEVIKIEDLGKQYRLGLIGTGTLSHDLNRWWASLVGKTDPYSKLGEENVIDDYGESKYVWALQNINVKVNAGEVLGIIGRNGAGKSTLLKILSRVTGPTSGSVKIRGRIGSLLEVGTGFHPELTGRENIFLNGAILGMTKKEVAGSFDEIVDFSGIEKYIDTPVKRYSSGMYVRLAFAVAAHLKPEILIVDEVLAVGDADFQKKCLGKMKDVSSEGRTVLFVSHNMGVIRNLCDRALVLENGKLVIDSDVKTAIDTYLGNDISKGDGKVNLNVYKRKNHISEFKLSSLELLNSLKKNTNDLFFGENFSMILKINCKTNQKFSVLIAIDTLENQRICTCLSDEAYSEFSSKNEEKELSILASFNSLTLLPGRYRVHLGIYHGKMGTVDYISDASILTIQDSTINTEIVPYKGNWGTIRYNPDWKVLTD